MARTSVKALANKATREDAKLRGKYTGSGIGTVDSFANFQQKLGMGTDNPLAASSYGFNPITRNRTLLEWIHRGSWLGGVAVDVVADDMTRAGIEYVTEMPPEDSEALDRNIGVLGVWNSINEVIRWARLYGGAIGVVLIDGQDLSTPLRLDTVGPGQFRGVLPLDRWMVEPSLEDLVDVMGPHLGLPRYYRVSSNAPALRLQRVHHTRVAFRCLGIGLPYQQALTENLWGISVIERLYDRMVAFDSASTGAAQLVFKSYLRTLKVKSLREIVAQGGQALQGLTAYVDTMRRFQGIEGMTVVDAEDEFEVQGHQAFSGLSDALDQFGQQIAGALQIPLVRLFGVSGGGLNGTNGADMQLYYDQIMQRQQKDLAHGVQLVYKLSARSLGINVPKGFMTEFRSLWELQAEQKATIAKTVSESVGAMKDAGLISEKTAMQELRQQSRKTGIFTNISEQDIAQADEQIGPPPGMELLAGLGGMPGAGPGLPAPTSKLPGLNKEPANGNAAVRPQGQAGPADKQPKSRVRLLPQAAPSGPANRAPGARPSAGGNPARPKAPN